MYISLYKSSFQHDVYGAVSGSKIELDLHDTMSCLLHSTLCFHDLSLRQHDATFGLQRSTFSLHDVILCTRYDFRLQGTTLRLNDMSLRQHDTTFRLQGTTSHLKDMSLRQHDTMFRLFTASLPCFRALVS